MSLETVPLYVTKKGAANAQFSFNSINDSCEIQVPKVLKPILEGFLKSELTQEQRKFFNNEAVSILHLLVSKRIVNCFTAIDAIFAMFRSAVYRP